MPDIQEAKDLISVIITVLNGDKWIDNCMESIVKQTAVQSHERQQKRNHHEVQYVTQHYEAQNPFMSTLTTSPLQLATSKTTEIKSNNVALQQLHTEVCVFDDYSCDKTQELLLKWKSNFKENYNIEMQIVLNTTGKSKGGLSTMMEYFTLQIGFQKIYKMVQKIFGYGRNKAIEASKGNYLCFQDIDDEMLPDRVWKQYNLAKECKNAIIGSKFIRIPNNSTCRFTKWANDLQSEELTLQIYTSNGPTIIMPTWLCHRKVYTQIEGGFSEEGRGCPEDLIFFYKHLDNQGLVKRVEECLLKYRYHTGATTFTVQAKTIWQIRLKYLLENVLRKKPWSEGFSIWNAGKQGRKFFRDLPQEQKNNVKTFCDVDKNKINKIYKYYDSLLRKYTYSIPIVHFSQVQPPVVICMKLDLTKGDFEINLQSLNLIEGQDYILFT